MSSQIEPLSPGSELLQYRLSERVGVSTWRAEDARTGKHVALKILTRQLPKDPTRRDAMVRDVRQTAAIHHANIVPILEIAPAGDILIMAMEWLDAEPLSRRLAGRPLDKATFFRFAYQIAEALKLVEGKNIVHQNVNGDSVLVQASGQVRLGGFNLLNLMPRRDGPSPAFAQKATEARSVAYMSPEQIGEQPVGVPTDVWSFGVVMYEMGTGRIPFQASTAADIAKAIAEATPPSPKVINANIEPAVLGVMGRCLFKDSGRRYKNAGAISDDIAKVDADAVAFANDLTKKVVAPVVVEQPRRALLLVADVANYDTVNAADPAGAAKSAARMQQILGEAVYLFDGQVPDPFGPRMIAELPNVDAALEAARKGEFDFSSEQQSGDVIPVRLLLHAGEVLVKEGVITGDAIVRATEVLRELPPQKLFISEDFAKVGRGNVRLRDAGARGGVKLYNIVPAEEPKVEISTAEFERLEHERQFEEAPTVAEPGAPRVTGKTAAAAKQKKKSMAFIGIAAAALLVILIGVAMLFVRRGEEPKHVAVAPSGPPPASAANPRTVFVEIFNVQGGDPALTERANAIRLATIEVLRSFPELRVVDAATRDAAMIGAQLRPGAAGPELVPTDGNATGGATAVPDAATGVASVVQWVAQRVKMTPRPVSTSNDAVNAFADAVVANAANDTTKAETSLRAAMTADPNFMPAQLMAMNFFDTRGKDQDAIAAAKQVLALDPANLDAAHKLAREELKEGDVNDGISVYAGILQRKPNDVEALNAIGRYAIAAGDEPRFASALARMKRLPANQVAVFEPDMLVASGRIEAAVDGYYAIEEKVQNNPALSLRIGRIAVLRHSAPIAELELQKLQKNDPDYGAHLLKAYLAATANDRATAEAELKTALAAAKPGDDSYTSAAEVYALLGDNKSIITSLETAAKRREPTANYILVNPLFRYLQSDAKFQSVRASVEAGQQEMKAAVAKVTL